MRGVITALALAVPAGVAAQESGAYLGGALGQTRFTQWCDPGTSACDDKDSGWKVFGGYRFNRHFALEGSYIDWGEVTATVAGPPLTNVAAKQRSYGLAALGSLQLGPQFAVFGKLGLLSTEQETRRVSPNPSTFTRDETELHYGVGAAYSLTSNWAIRGEWENTEKLKVQMLSIGVEYRF
jgi:OmpA-OmpF porin, OOP family